MHTLCLSLSVAPASVSGYVPSRQLPLFPILPVRQSAKHSPQYYEPDEKKGILAVPDVRPRKWRAVSAACVGQGLLPAFGDLSLSLAVYTISDVATALAGIIWTDAEGGASFAGGVSGYLPEGRGILRRFQAREFFGEERVTLLSGGKYYYMSPSSCLVFVLLSSTERRSE